MYGPEAIRFGPPISGGQPRDADCAHPGALRHLRPSNHEERRAEFCCRWLKNLGAENVYIDEALNVILPIGCEGSDDITIFMAHIDTVFPDTEPMPLREENGRLYCPGVGDDTVNVAMLMLIAKYLLEQRITPSHGIVFAMNSGEGRAGQPQGKPGSDAGV